MKKLILGLLIISLALSQTFTFGGGTFNQNTNIANCVRQQGNTCLECIEDYEFNDQTGQCQDTSIQNDAQRCTNGQDNCGQSDQFTPNDLSELSRKNPQETTIFQNIVEQARVGPQPTDNDDFGQTNTQQPNIDEADLVKTDSNYLYVVANHRLYIILGYHPSNFPFQIVFQINYDPKFKPEALFIEGDHVALFGTATDGSSVFTQVYIYSVALNRGFPVEIANYKFEGSYFDGRKTNDGWVYLLTTMNLRPILTPWYNVNGIRTHVNFGSMFIYRGDNVQFPTYLNVISFDLRNVHHSRTKMVCLITEAAHKIYMTYAHIYLMVEKDQGGQLVTIVHKVFVWRWFIVPFADITLPGVVNNQFNLDEFNGYILRVVTTSFSGGQSVINVYTMGYWLQALGAETGLLPGSQVTSVRYFGRRAYIGTNNGQFTIVSFWTHFDPQKQGTFNLSGFSRFIQLYSPFIVFSFGRSSSANTGLKIWVLDTTDPNAITQLGFFELDEAFASSEVEFEHKAFRLEQNYIVLPVQISNQFNGALLLKMNTVNWTFNVHPIFHFIQGTSFDFRKERVKRSTFIKDNIFTISDCSVLRTKENVPHTTEGLTLC